MASELSNLMRRVTELDPAVGKELRRQIASLTQRRENGLNFERHLPEQVALVGRPVSVGDKVRFIPERGSVGDGPNTNWVVTGIEGPKSGRVAQLVERVKGTTCERAVDDLVYVADFRDPIFPGLKSTHRIDSGGNGKPFHAVINAENYHALEALLFTHAGEVDVIYIDPPYNTGGKSFWLYNDDYVDKEDGFRHSKWLAFMERRLLMAKRLLAPAGVLLVSIDDAEQHRLRMLLDQVFGEKNFVDTLAVELSTTSGPKTVNAQQGTIVKNVEFVHIYKRSAAFDEVHHTPLYDSVDGWDSHYSKWLNDDGTITDFYDALWAHAPVRSDIERFGFTKKDGTFTGKAAMDKLLAVSRAANDFILDNLDRIARFDSPPVSVREMDAPIGGWINVEADHRTYTITKLGTGVINQVYALQRNYRTSDDAVPRFGRTVIRGDLWKGFHADMGNVAKEGGVKFSNGKKPVRLIKQLVRWANNDPDAVILDFFAGSGTTAHAVMAMNSEDGGRRRSIVITNNELNEATRNLLRKKSLRPGDEDWESQGVYRSVTMPRLMNVANDPAVAENVEFFRLTYLNPQLVELDMAFSSVAPLLWLRAGAQGRRIDERTDTFDVADTYAVLFSLDASAAFISAVEQADGLRVAYIVTDDEPQFQAVATQLPEGVEAVRLYESYLRTFQINTERD